MEHSRAGGTRRAGASKHLHLEFQDGPGSVQASKLITDVESLSPSKKLIDFFPLNMNQVQDNLLNKQMQSFARRNSNFAVTLQGHPPTSSHINSVPLPPVTTTYTRSPKNSFQEPQPIQSASKAISMPGSMLHAVPLRHTSFYAGADQHKVSSMPEALDSHSDPSAHTAPSNLHSDFALPMEDSHVLQGESSEVADSVDLSLLPRRHSLRMHQQQIQADVESALRKSKARTRLGELMGQSSVAVHGGLLSAHGVASNVKATTPKGYSTAHLSGKSLTDMALSSVARAERMLNKLKHQSAAAIQLEIDSRPGSRDDDFSIGPRRRCSPGDVDDNIMDQDYDLYHNDGGGSGSVAQSISNKTYAKAQLWGNGVVPDSVAIMRAGTLLRGSKEGVFARASLGAAAAAAVSMADFARASARFKKSSKTDSVSGDKNHGSSHGGMPVANSWRKKLGSFAMARNGGPSGRKTGAGSMLRGTLMLPQINNNGLKFIEALKEEVTLASAAKQRIEKLEQAMSEGKIHQPRRSYAAGKLSEGRKSGGQSPVRETTIQEKEEKMEAGSEAEKDDESRLEAFSSGQLDPQTKDRSLHNFRAILESREGAMYSGTYGRSHALRERMRKEQQSLIRSNPVAFQEDIASQADAKLSAMAERAHLRYDAAAEAMMEPHAVENLRMAILQLQCERPFFLPPIYEKERVERAHIQVEKVQIKPTWQLANSLFNMRKKENESRDYFDSENARNIQFNIDWQRVAAKVRFRRLVGRNDKGVKANGERLEQELSEVRMEVAKYKNELRNIFNYYSMLTGPMASDKILSMNATQWLSFCEEAGILDNNQRGCTSTDLQNIFIAVNFEEESEGIEAEENDDDAMMRFEFYEGIVRSSFGKFITTGLMDDASDATVQFIEEVVLKNVAPESLIDPNVFRRDRLYTCEMDELIAEHWDLLVAMYKMYKAKDRTKYFWIENWAALLEATQLLGVAGFERKDAKIIFVWSQMLVTDELKRRKRAVGLMFYDFVEALARLAEYFNPPSLEELCKTKDKPEISREEIVVPLNEPHPFYTYITSRGYKRPKSGGLLGGGPMPLHIKFDTLMHYMLHHHRNAWGGRDGSECAAKMMKIVSILGGGIELG